MIWAILRGLIWGIVDDYPFGDSAGPSADSKKENPWWEDKGRAAKEPAASPENPRTNATMPGWWAAPAPPATPPTIKVETDAGTFIATTTFSGPNLMGIRRVERSRQEGESRRRRRASTAPASPVRRADVELRPREPAVPLDPAGKVETAAHEQVELRPREPAVPEVAPSAAQAVGAGIVQPGDTPASKRTPRSCTDVATPIDPAEAPRVARARRVRGRLADSDRSSPRLATTLATRLALAASALNSPAPVAVREGA
ncbi:hypothetical protein [Nannocystis exedens]|uniref:hypothetical protein n=1 Tax=Nannocystis exedens TaxID=54 RepID=UPI0011603B6A|nr:hypothetical protein [Nannocystis exedens]